MALKKEEIFKQKPSKEETTYTAAVELMNAVDCLERFEREVSALRDAASRFEKLGDYKNAKQYREDCIRLAEEAEKTGSRKVYELALRKRKSAVSKSDYVDVMEELRRVQKYEPYQDQVKKELQFCKERIRRLETIAAYKRRGIVVLSLLIIAACLSQTPVYPIAKGVVHRYRGEYQAALNCYAEGANIPGVGKLQRDCYYRLAGQALADGQDAKAMKLYRLAWNRLDAPKHTAQLEQQLLGQAKCGDTVFFGGRNWTVLEKQTGRVLLLARHAPQFHPYDQGGTARWEDSTLKTWMEQSFLGGSFLETEKEIVLDADTDDDTGKAYLLSEREYQEYREQIPEISNRWWLRDNVLQEGYAKCVWGEEILTIPSDTKKIAVRPAMWVKAEDE